MTEYIHGGSDAREVARLEKQAGFIAPLEMKYLDAAPGMKVLDLATGVGAMAEELVRRFPGIELTGLDLRASQLEVARQRHPVAQYVLADATRMPFPDRTFDRVHCSWLLEHVPAPLDVLKEVHRVLKPSGYCHFIEVDNSKFETHPRLPAVTEAMDALNRAQQLAGGDPFIGPKLNGLFSEAGFAPVRIIPCPIRGSAEDPVFFQRFVDEFAEIFESLDEALGPEQGPLIRAAVALLRGLLRTPGASLRYESTIAQGFRPAA